MLDGLLKHPIFKNSFISFIGFGVTGLLGYLFQFFMSRRLSIANYGEFQSLVALLSILGVGSAALSYFVIAHASVFACHSDVEANRQFISWLRQKLSLLLIILFFIIIALSWPLQQILHLNSLWSTIIIGVTAVLSLNTVIYISIFTGWQNFFAVNVLTVASTVAKLLAGILIISFFPTATAATLVLALSAAGSYLLARSWSVHKFQLNQLSISSSNASWSQQYFAHRRVAADLGYIVIFTFLVLFMQNADVLFVKHFASADLAGHYGAFNLLGKIILWINLGIISATLPLAIAHEHTGAHATTRVRLYAYILISLVSLTVISLYLFIPVLLIKLSIGANYILYAPALWLIGLMNALLSLLLLEANFAFARRDLLVLPILGTTALVFTTGILFSPTAIASVAKSGIIAFGLGGISLLLFNLHASHSKKEIAPVPITTPPITGQPV
jgi:O-antigen/teichoic acid export membrane protein